MWLENEKFRELGHAVCQGEVSILGRFFLGIFHPENQYSAKITVCPRCKKNLVGKMLPDLEYFVQACPEGHGAWMSPEVFGKVRGLIHEQLGIASKRKRALSVLGTCFVFGFCFVLATHAATLLQNTRLTNQSVLISQEEKMDALRKLPVFSDSGNGIQNIQESEYFFKVLPVLEEAAEVRMTVESVLKMKLLISEKEAAFKQYLKKQKDFESRLRSFYVPESLGSFHGKILSAIQNQKLFYALWLKQKEEAGDDDFEEKMLTHPLLLASHQLLVGAQAEVMRLYPEMNEQNSRAIEKRLCWLDII